MVLTIFSLRLIKNVALRESCYKCKYCGVDRISDFTLADFLGCYREKSKFRKTKNGISIVTFNSDKAIQLKNQLREYMYLEKIDSSEAIPFNNAFIEPNTRPINRDRFYDMMDKMSIFII